jgi:hypothetical protein
VASSQTFADGRLRGEKSFDRLSPQRRYLASLNMIVHLVDGTYELFRHFYRVKGFA